jgi:hypothetical protein
MYLRPTMAIAIFLCLGASLPAQNQEQFKQLRTEKMAKDVFTKAAWTFDYDKARAEARKSGKPIFAYFTRSYAH